MQFSGNDEERKENRISGGNGEREPPVPIPNTEVKPLSAESTWLETARENRTLPDSKRLRRVISTQSFFLPNFSKLWMVLDGQLGLHRPDVQVRPDRSAGHVYDQRHKEPEQRVPIAEPQSHGLSQRHGHH